jgi:hypothetical protein
MKTFADLEFKPHELGGNNTRARLNFDNGYGISVITLPDVGYTGYEIAVLADDEITYGTPITDDVIPYLSSDEVTEIMRQIQELPK